MVGVSAIVNLPLHHKVQKFSSGTGSPGWSRKKGGKTVVWWLWCFVLCLFASVVLGLVSSVTYYHKRLPGKIISKMIYFVWSWM